MSRLEDDDFGALWRAQDPAHDRHAFEQAARRTPRVARTVQVGEALLAIALTVVIVLAVAWRFGSLTLLIGGMMLVMLCWSAWRRHRLTDNAFLLHRGDRIGSIDVLLRAKDAELARSRLGLLLMGPGTLLAAMLGYLLQTGAPLSEFGGFILAAAGTPRGVAATVYLCGLAVILVRAHRRIDGERGRLLALRGAYAREAQLDAHRRGEVGSGEQAYTPSARPGSNIR